MVAALVLMGWLLAAGTASAICSAPAVGLDPVDQTVCAGTVVTFIAAATGSPTPTIQWEVNRNDGTGFHSIDNATGNSLSFVVSPSQNGYQYHAMFFNECGFNRSAPATLTVRGLELSILSVSPSVVWPPNNKMVLVTINFAVSSPCGAATGRIISITNNETGNGDAQIVDSTHALVRATRFGYGRDRIYTITVGATDSTGSATTRSVIVTVPHDQRR